MFRKPWNLWNWLLVLVALAVSVSAALAAQSRDADFKKLAAQIVAQRQAGKEENPELQERALGILDELAMAALNLQATGAPPSDLPDLSLANARLQGTAAGQERVGESYVIIQVGSGAASASAAVYALAANFSWSGPSAVRLYVPQSLPAGNAAQRSRGYKLAGRIDRLAFLDFFDEYLEVVAVNTGARVFVTVTGRTDDRKTGSFAAWRAVRGKVEAVWSSDLLEHSTYEVKDSALRIDYCAEPDEEKPALCKKMLRDRYVWNGGWMRTAQDDISPKTTSR